MNKNPLVSIVMPVYNGARYLRSAIECILNQTFTDFEFVIVNDGSTDNSAEIIKSYSDPRIKLIEKEKNSGIVETLNQGIRAARGSLIARMDADDISLPERIKKQVNFLREHPEVGVLGTTMQLLNENGSLSDVDAVVTEDEDIRKALLVANMLVHGSVVVRRDILEKIGLYNKSAHHVEDYDLWTRASEHTKIANLPEVLYQWRINTQGLSHLNTKVQSATEKQVRDLVWDRVVRNNKLPQPSIKNALVRKKFYLSRSDRFKKKRIRVLASVSAKYARSLWFFGRRKLALYEFVSAVIAYPNKVQVYFVPVAMIIGQIKADRLENLIRKIYRALFIVSKRKLLWTLITKRELRL